MKVFIVFLALTIINMSFIAFSFDFNNYSYISNDLKILAEDCAAGAALAIDLDAYSDGNVVIDVPSATAYAEHICEKNSQTMPKLRRGETTLSDIEVNEDSVSVTLEYVQDDDLFRLPFFSAHHIVRDAEYKWE